MNRIGPWTKLLFGVVGIGIGVFLCVTPVRTLVMLIAFAVCFVVAIAVVFAVLFTVAQIARAMKAERNRWEDNE